MAYRPFRYPPAAEVGRALVGLGALGADTAAAPAPPGGVAAPRKTTQATAVARRLPAAGVPASLQRRMGVAADAGPGSAAEAILAGDVGYLFSMGRMPGDALAEEVLASNTYRTPGVTPAAAAAMYGGGFSSLMGFSDFGQDEATALPAAEPQGPTWVDETTKLIQTLTPVATTVVSTVTGKPVVTQQPARPPPELPQTRTQTGLVVAAVGLAGLLGYLVLKRRREAALSGFYGW